MRVAGLGYSDGVYTYSGGNAGVSEWREEAGDTGRRNNLVMEVKKNI